jgi:hypothetical protein
MRRMLNPACIADIPEATALLPVRATERPYALREFLRRSPRLHANIASNSTRVPLTLHLHLRDAGQRPLSRVAVCIWQHDSHGETIDFLASELDTLACMRGLQFSDAEGWVRFRTVYPMRFDAVGAPIYLQLFFNDGEHVNARSDVCLLMPEHGTGPLHDILLAQPAPLGMTCSRFDELDGVALVILDRLRIDETLGGLHADVTLRLDT